MRFIGIWCLLFIFCLQGVVIAQDAEGTETIDPPITITIWWPENFARVNESSINPTLLLQSDAFASQYNNLNFDHRLKMTGGVTGGIMSTLRSASSASRATLPTLTLLRRQDLITAQSNGYLQSIEGFSSAILGDVNHALSLGQLDDVLYGIPYLLNLQHVVYRPDEAVSYDEWTYDAVLEREQSIIFPAGRVSSLNDVLTLQYIADGGLSNSENNLALDVETLSTLFDYYQTSIDEELLTGEVLNYTTPSSYLATFITGEIDSAVMTSEQYLSLINNADDTSESETLAIAPIPTQSGNTTTLLNGWMWVMVTDDADEQAIALEYLNYLFASEQQGEVAQAVGLLPSRERAITDSLSDTIDTDFYLELIENSIIPLSDSNIGAIGREIQTQFSTILTLEQSASDALQAVINAVGE